MVDMVIFLSITILATMESAFDTQQDHEGAIMMASLSQCAHSSPVARIADGSNVSSEISTLRQRIDVDMLLGTQLELS